MAAPPRTWLHEPLLYSEPPPVVVTLLEPPPSTPVPLDALAPPPPLLDALAPPPTPALLDAPALASLELLAPPAITHAPPTQAPPAQRLPSGLGGFEHCPVTGAQVPAE